jgi:hypothetical protein
MSEKIFTLRLLRTESRLGNVIKVIDLVTLSPCFESVRFKLILFLVDLMLQKLNVSVLALFVLLSLIFINFEEIKWPIVEGK